jgi:ribonuclease R
MLNKESVFEFFRDKTKPFSFREISQSMALSRPEARSLKRVLRELVRDGEIVLTRKGLYGPAEEMSLITGYYEAHRDGFGFVITEKPGERDLFIPPRAAMGAMNGDRVTVKVENWKKREGRIIRVLERTFTKVVGKIDIAKNATFIKPKNKTIPFDLYVAPSDRGKAKNGDNVLAEIISYPTDKRPPSARVIRVIEKPGDPGEDIEIIIDEFNLPRKFPKAVTEATKLLYEKSSLQKHAEKRKDLRELPTVTIDGERAKDFDDAVSISRTEQGYRLWVHIADVGYYVPWDSPVDVEARKRGTSVYFTDRVIPMLPKELSEDLCSLRPKTDKLSFTVEMDFDKHGRRLDANFYPSIIKSDERMTYTSVKKVLVDRDEGERNRYGYLLGDFELMGELCDIMRSARLGRGSLDFDLPEPEVLLDLQGNPEAILKAERNYAHMIIEEFMIAANEAVAERLERQGVPNLYRIHEEPDPMKLEDILKTLKTLGKLKRNTLKPKDFSGILKAVKGAPEEEIINYIVLRSLKQARYSPTNAGHFGLASDSYSHFTSPIRRYPDLVTHRILREVLTRRVISDRRKQELESMLPDIAFSSSRTERVAEAAEKVVIRAMRVWFMKDKVGDEFDAKVVGVSPYGLRVRLNDFYVEGFINLSSMTDDYYQYSENTMRLTGRHTHRSFKLGQELRLRVDKVDMEEREVLFGIV